MKGEAEVAEIVVGLGEGEMKSHAGCRPQALHLACEVFHAGEPGVAALHLAGIGEIDIDLGLPRIDSERTRISLMGLG